MTSVETGFAERLELLINTLNVKSVNAFALSIGVAASVIQNFLGKKASGKKSKPSLETIEKIKARYPRVNLEWLLTGDGEILKPYPGQEQNVTMTANTGNVIGTMHGGTVTYTSIEQCLKDLEACRGRVRELEGMIGDKQLIIDLLKQQSAK